MIRLKNVSKVYATTHGDVRALDDITLEIQRGEFVAVCGPSGCGKSTLLSLVGALATPSSGSVEIDDQLVNAMSSRELAKFRAEHIGFVFQMFHLLPYLDVLTNVVLGAESPTSSEAMQRAESLLKQFGLAARLSHRPGQLSAGERQRVAVARALINEPAILLADEPTGNLDPENAESLLDLLSDFQASGGTILLATHDQRAASRGDRVVSLRDGRLSSTSSPQLA